MHPQHSQAPGTTLRPILQPGVPTWVSGLVGAPSDTRSALVQAGAVVGFVGLIVGLGAGLSYLGSTAPRLAVVLLVAVVAAGVAGGLAIWRYLLPRVVMGPTWSYRGVRIKGEAFKMLEDIDSRFAYARKMIGEVPTGIDWGEVAPEVQTLMWESAGHAARVSALDTEITEMRYAARGTPQGALKRSMEDRRAEHWEMLKSAQREADALASVAGNAAAAAKFALLRTGSLAALEVVTPTAQGLAARHALADARARLELLAEVWSHLDEDNVVLAEQIDHERAKQLSAPTEGRRKRARRR